MNAPTLSHRELLLKREQHACDCLDKIARVIAESGYAESERLSAMVRAVAQTYGFGPPLAPLPLPADPVVASRTPYQHMVAVTSDYLQAHADVGWSPQQLRQICGRTVSRDSWTEILLLIRRNPHVRVSGHTTNRQYRWWAGNGIERATVHAEG